MKFITSAFTAVLALCFACQTTSQTHAGQLTTDTLSATQPRKAFNEGKIIQTIATLSSDAYEGRKPGSQGYEMAKKFIIHAFDSLGLKKFGNSYEQPFSSKLRGQDVATPTANLVAYIPGTEDSTTFLIVGAHYDHVGIEHGQIHNGADDNASGVGGLLAVADYFSKNKPKHSILLLAFDAEESGLQGAKYFVSNPMVPLSQVAMMINMDMISRSDKREVYASGAYHYPVLKGYLDEVAKENTAVRLMQGHDAPKSTGTDLQDWTQSSDHGPFHNAKIPYIYFGVEDHPHYHKPSDDFGTINSDFYLNVVSLVVGAVEKFDQSLGHIKSKKQ